MKGIIENVSIARNGQIVLRVNGLDYWTNEGYLHSVMSSKGLPADIFLLQGCELEFEKVSHKAGDKVIDGNGKETGQLYKKDGQRMNRPSILALGGEAQTFRQEKTKQQAKMALRGAVGSFKKSERSAPADNIIKDIRKDGSVTTQTKPVDETVLDGEETI